MLEIATQHPLYSRHYSGCLSFWRILVLDKGTLISVETWYASSSVMPSFIWCDLQCSPWNLASLLLIPAALTSMSKVWPSSSNRKKKIQKIHTKLSVTIVLLSCWRRAKHKHWQLRSVTGNLQVNTVHACSKKHFPCFLLTIFQGIWR